MELGHLPTSGRRSNITLGSVDWRSTGRKKSQRHVADVVKRLIAALEPDEIVLGGGNVKKLKEPPPGCRLGNNANAFLGGFRLWKDAGARKRIILPKAGGHLGKPAKSYRPLNSG